MDTLKFMTVMLTVLLIASSLLTLILFLIVWWDKDFEYAWSIFKNFITNILKDKDE